MGQAFQVYAFLCGARDYHAMDCYQSAKQLYRDKQVMVVTDLLAAEGLESLATDDDIVEKPLIIDRFLIRRRCRLADLRPGNSNGSTNGILMPSSWLTGCIICDWHSKPVCPISVRLKGVRSL